MNLSGVTVTAVKKKHPVNWNLKGGRNTMDLLTL